MRRGNRGFVAIIVAGMFVSPVSIGAATTDDDAALDTRPAGTETPIDNDTLRRRDKVIAVGGGLLVIALAAIGLTITFRSLGTDLRDRKRRYRRRVHRETHGD